MQGAWELVANYRAGPSTSAGSGVSIGAVAIAAAKP